MSSDYVFIRRTLIRFVRRKKIIDEKIEYYEKEMEKIVAPHLKEWAMGNYRREKKETLK